MGKLIYGVGVLLILAAPAVFGVGVFQSHTVATTSELPATVEVAADQPRRLIVTIQRRSLGLRDRVQLAYVACDGVGVSTRPSHRGVLVRGRSPQPRLDLTLMPGRRTLRCRLAPTPADTPLVATYPPAEFDSSLDTLIFTDPTFGNSTHTVAAAIVAVVGFATCAVGAARRPKR